MTGAELLVRCLEREGVRYVFGVPGEETLDVNEALADSTVRFRRVLAALGLAAEPPPQLSGGRSAVSGGVQEPPP